MSTGISLQIFESMPNGPSYWATFRQKVLNNIPMLTKDGNEVTIDSGDERWQFLTESLVFDKTTRLKMEQFKSGSGYKIPLVTRNTISLGNILKNNVKVVAKYNLGDVSEGIMASAIGARFINKNRRISINDLENVIKEMKKNRNGNSSIKIFKSENARHPKMSKILYDDVKVSINLASANMDMLFTDDANEKSILRSLMSPCISYANSTEINTAALMMYRNGKKDYIDIIADGVSDQKGTKIDIKLIINGMVDIPIEGNLRQSKLNLTQISLKKEVNQFAQVGGWSLETIDKFWGKILNSNPSNNSVFVSLYENMASQSGTTEEVAATTMRSVYDWANSQLQSKIKNKSWVSHFVNTLDNFATYGEQNVALVEISKSGYHRYNFKKLSTYLTGNNPPLTLQTSYQTGATGLPTVIIYGVSKTENYPLVQFRFKMERGIGGKPKAIRNYVEKKEGLVSLIT
jgi:hypothetical protein